jgi:hypothetical protein
MLGVSANLPMNCGRLCGLALSLVVALSACTSDAAKRSAYEALHQKGCMDRTGVPNCDPDHPSYETYKKEREKVLEGQ